MLTCGNDPHEARRKRKKSCTTEHPQWRITFASHGSTWGVEAGRERSSCAPMEAVAKLGWPENAWLENRFQRVPHQEPPPPRVRFLPLRHSHTGHNDMTRMNPR